MRKTIFLLIIVAIVSIVPISVRGYEVIDSVVVDSFPLGIAEDVPSALISPHLQALQKVANLWLEDTTSILIVTGMADGHEWALRGLSKKSLQKLDNALNPAIGVGRQILALKILDSLGVKDLSRVLVYTMEFKEKGGKYRGFVIERIRSSWLTKRDVQWIQKELERDCKRLKDRLDSLIAETRDTTKCLPYIEAGVRAGYSPMLGSGFTLVAKPYLILKDRIRFEYGIGFAIDKTTWDFGDQEIKTRTRFQEFHVSLSFPKDTWYLAVSGGGFQREDRMLKVDEYFNRRLAAEIGFEFGEYLWDRVSGAIYVNYGSNDEVGKKLNYTTELRIEIMCKILKFGGER